MKRRFIAIALILGFVALLFPTHSLATEEGWYLRLRAGGSNASFYQGDKLLGDESRNTFTGGVSGDLIFRENLGWDFGIAYVPKGAKGTITMDSVDPGNTEVFEGTAKLDYVVLSTNLVMFLPIREKSEARIFVGPAIGILASAKAEGTVGGNEVERDLKGGLKGWEMLVTVGAAYTYDFGKVSAFVDFRTEFGVTDVDNSERAPGLMTRASMLTLGVGIPVGLFEEESSY